MASSDPRATSPPTPRRRTFLASLAACAASAATRGARAGEAYPSRPVTLVVPWPPGGSNDLMARLVAAALEGGLGRPVVVDNRPGASGTVGAALVARAEPDGHTLLWGSLATQVLAPTRSSTVAYDPEADFAAVALVASVPMVLVAHPALPARSVAELLDLLRAEPGRHGYATAGDGTPAHLAGEMLGRMAGVEMVHVPYQGSGPALAAVMGGHVPLMIDVLPTAGGHVRAGRLRALAVLAVRRAPALPEVPTLAEAAPGGLLDGLDLHAWSGLFAPAGTPRTVLDRLNTEVRRALDGPALRTRLEAMGAHPTPSTPEGLAALVSGELVRWAPVSGDHAE
jgi:tripartite-type tricarboxylate transporter receptor subunit TctC